MTFKILGRKHCRYCRLLSQRTERALVETGIEPRVEYIEDPDEMYTYGTLAVPALIIDETLVIQGKVPTVDMIKDLIIRRN